MNIKQTKFKRSSNDEIDAIAWLKSQSEETPEKQIIRDEEWTKYNLAEALSKAREAAGYSQSSLAQELGVQQSLVSKWEHINHNHTLETLLNLARATGAKLVLGLEVDGKLIPVSSAAKRCVLLSETVHANLEERGQSVGLTARELLLAPLAVSEIPKKTKRSRKLERAAGVS